MAWGDNSSPTAFLQGQHVSDDRKLALEVFGGEVLTAFDLNTITLDKVQTRQLSGGAKSARFPKVWKATAEYHSRGKEMLGNKIETGEITISVDDILVSHVAIYDLDDMLSHFEVSSQFSSELGRGLARVFDKNNFRQLILAARVAADGPFPGGHNVTDDALKPNGSGVYSGAAWIDAIRTANSKLFAADVPEDMPRYMAVPWGVFDAIKYAKDADGNYLVLNRDFQADNAGGISQRREVIRIDGVDIYRSRNMPSTDETADTSVYAKYRANFALTKAVLWTPMATATVKMRDISLEQTRDTRRLENFMVANMLVGHGTLRPECAVEFKSAT